VETESERGFKKGIDKAISLLNRKKKEILKHRKHCKEWRKIGISNFDRIYCLDCHIGSISRLIEPLMFQLKNIKNSTKYDGDFE
jgi:hypothetical protein